MAASPLRLAQSCVGSASAPVAAMTVNETNTSPFNMPDSPLLSLTLLVAASLQGRTNGILARPEMPHDQAKAETSPASHSDGPPQPQRPDQNIRCSRMGPSAMLRRNVLSEARSAEGLTGKARSEHIPSGLPPRADIIDALWHFRFVPKPAVSNRSNAARYSITSSARARSDGGMSSPSALAVLR